MIRKTRAASNLLPYGNLMIDGSFIRRHSGFYPDPYIYTRRMVLMKEPGTIASAAPFRRVVRFVLYVKRTGYSSRGDWVDQTVCPFDDEDAIASGEGCMLWMIDGLWEPRNRSGKGTLTIVKYKPTMLIAAVVRSQPHHSHRTPYQRRSDDPLVGVRSGGGADDADNRLSGSF